MSNYVRKTRDYYVVQQYLYGMWHDVTAEDSRREARARLAEYRKNQPEYPARLVTKREPITQGA